MSGKVLKSRESYSDACKWVHVLVGALWGSTDMPKLTGNIFVRGFAYGLPPRR
jgi:hypothetical protein